MDVNSLYTNIPNSEGSPESPIKQSQRKLLQLFLVLLLTRNNFVFNCKHFRQIKGCTMRTICASAYADIFMAKLEIYIYIYIYIYPIIKNMPMPSIH